MNPILIIPIFIAFFITFLFVPSWIKKAKSIGLVGRDINKYKKIEVAEGGGVVVIFGFIIGVLSYIAIKTFYFKSDENLISIFALISSIIMIAFIGMIDNVLGWKIGLGRKIRVFLVLVATIPLIVINAGYSHIGLPFFGEVDMGILYPFLLIPIGIVGAATTFNFLAGFNGLEAGQGILILTSLSIVAYFTGSTWLTLIGLCMVLSLIAFWVFNRYPAKTFPGDVLTYPVGAMIAIMAIFGNFEKIAVFFFIPYILEVFLKLRGKLIKQSFGKPNEDGSLDLRYDKIYGVEHLSIWILKKIRKDKKAYEKDVVNLIHALQIIIILIGFFIFRNYIF